MSNRELEFDTISMDDNEYKLFKLASMNSDELDKVDKEAQTLLIDVRDTNKATIIIGAMAPCDWFSSEEDFKNRLMSDFAGQLWDELDKLRLDSIYSLGTLINNMGIKSLIRYVDKEKLRAIKEEENGEEYIDQIQLELIRCMTVYFVTRDLADLEVEKTGYHNKEKTLLRKLIDKCEVSIGMLAIGTSMEEEPKIKHTYAVFTEINWLDDFDLDELTDEEYEFMLSEVYMTFLALEVDRYGQDNCDRWTGWKWKGDPGGQII